MEEIKASRTVASSVVRLVTLLFVCLVASRGREVGPWGWAGSGKLGRSRSRLEGNKWVCNAAFITGVGHNLHISTATFKIQNTHIRHLDMKMLTNEE